MAAATLSYGKSEVLKFLVEVYVNNGLGPSKDHPREIVNCKDGDEMLSVAELCSTYLLRFCLGLEEAATLPPDDETLKAVADILRTSNLLKVSDDGKMVGKIADVGKPKERTYGPLDDDVASFVKCMAELYLCSDYPKEASVMKLIDESEDGMIDVERFCLSAMAFRSKLGLEMEEAFEVYDNDDERVPEKAVPEDILKAVVNVLRTSTYLRVSEDGSKVGKGAELRLVEANP